VQYGPRGALWVSTETGEGVDQVCQKSNQSCLDPT
jgi:hypothetical protein